MNYFKYFPIISHSNQLCRNIMNRISVEEDSTLLSYDMDEHNHRSDIIAYKYYDSFGFDWLVKLSNQVVDPYYDMGLTETEFQDFITQKYGSMDAAAANVLFYQNNWRDDPSIIPQGSYDILTDAQKPYWCYEYDYNGLPVGYKRLEQDWVVNTNKTIGIEVESHSYQVGDIVTQSDASGQLISANSTYLILENITGEFSNVAIGGYSPFLTVTELSVNISDDVAHYWRTVSALEYEEVLNQEKKSIKLLDNRLKNDALDRLKNSYV